MKLIPMLLLAFFIGFTYHIVRNVKDSLLVTAASSAEVIPFVKVWAMLPMAVLATAIFVRLSHRHSPEKVFYIMVSTFLAFFALFTFVLYPMRDLIHPHAMADIIQAHVPSGLRGMVTVFRYWSFSLFYGMAELWGVIVLSVLFWGYINEVTSIDQARRFYSLVGLGANISSIASGWISASISNHALAHMEQFGTDAWHHTLMLLTTVILVSGIILMATFYWLSSYCRNIEGRAAEQLKTTDKMKKPSIKKSFGYLAKSKYLIYIATIVVSYNIVINLVEVLWKDQVRMLYPDPNAYNAYMGHVTTWTGVIATVFALLVSGNVVRLFGWTLGALITPIILILTSIGFFTFYFFGGEGVAAFLSTTPLTLIVFFGGAQNCLSRASKFTVFDKTKEMAFIPLARSERVQGKAAIDGVASRVGKSGSSLVYQGLLLLFGELSIAAPYVVGLLCLTLSGWLLAIRNLGRRFDRLTDQEPEPQPQPTTPEALPQT